jgi:23S rRNA pseudoU1915 N3-methylase RlmH
MQNLFDACSPFYVEQKALMVSRLERELKSYIDDIALLATLRDVNDYSPTQENFTQLTEIERQKSELMFDQTNIQSKIITLLISGKSAQGAEVAALLKDAQSISEFLSVLDHRVDAIRDTVTE